MTRALLVMCLAWGCVSTEETARRGLLGDCTFNDECQSPLICAARRCRAECRTDRDCTNNWRCRSAGQGGKFVCYDPADLATGCEYASHCTMPYVCGPGNICQAQCNDNYDCEIRRLGTTCILSAPGVGFCSDHPWADAGTPDAPSADAPASGG